MSTKDATPARAIVLRDPDADFVLAEPEPIPLVIEEAKPAVVVALEDPTPTPIASAPSEWTQAMQDALTQRMQDFYDARRARAQQAIDALRNQLSHVE
jgi:hypothetical protein